MSLLEKPSIYNAQSVYNQGGGGGGGGGGGVIDPSIVLLFDGVSNYGYQPIRGILNPTIRYDADGPLDVSGTGWTGTPYVWDKDLGEATTLTQIHDNNHGMHWNQADLVDLNKFGGEFTLDFWYKVVEGTNRGNLPSVMFSDGYNWSIMLTNYYYQINAAVWYKNGSQQPILYCDFNNSVWTHLAISQKSGKLYLFVNGVKVYEGSDFHRSAQSQLFSICSVYDSRGSANIAQVCVRNVAKWTDNFTPPTRPYILGELV